MALIRWRNQNYPATVFDHLRNEINRSFRDALGQDAFPYLSSTYPAVNLYENSDNLFLTAELPGLAAGDIEINVESESVQIKGERKIEHEGEGGHYHRREREGGTFIKKIALPVRINTGNVEAAMENGVLKVTMPKAEDVKPKKIQVKVS